MLSVVTGHALMFKELRQHSKNKTRVKTISRALKRTPGALRQKARALRDPARPSPRQKEAVLTG